jgi:hypothetical protein
MRLGIILTGRALALVPGSHDPGMLNHGRASPGYYHQNIFFPETAGQGRYRGG